MKGKWLILVIVSLFALVLTACSGDSETSSDQTETESESSSNEKEETESQEDDTLSESSEVQLPDSVTITSYDIGSGGYTELSAISDAITKEFGTQIRMMPSASGLGRLSPLKDGTADIGGRLADEVYFAFEGIEEFASRDWGPQNLRYLTPMLNHFGMFALDDSGIETVYDLVGKKVPYVIGNPSVNVKIEGLLHGAGLTEEDVEMVEIASYGDQPQLMAQGQIDVSFMVPAASAVYEADELHGVHWLDHSYLNDEEALERLREVYPFALPDEWDIGGALTKGEPEVLMAYVTYAPATYAEQDPDLIYNWLKAMDETFDMYKDSTSTMFLWDLNEVPLEPLGVPLHEGAVRFFEEKGMWTEEYEAKNNEYIERQEKLQEAWETVVAEADEQRISDEEFAEFWLERKAELVD